MNSANKLLPAKPATTAIGSLPHHNVDAALSFSFGLDVPFLPQIPIRNPWEFMIAQTLEGMPGLQVEKDGTVTLDQNVWAGRAKAFDERLLAAFDSAAKPGAFEGFEPSNAISSCWQPFLWELSEKGTKLAKVQIAGPLTAQWALRWKDGSSLESHHDVSGQVFRLVLARALAMTRRLSGAGVQPMIYLDEPGLYVFDAANPRHTVAIRELKLVVQALRKENVIVGLHCCSNTDWKTVFGLEANVLSIDSGLSLETLLMTAGPELQKFIEDGGRLSLGVIPTTHALPLSAMQAKDLFDGLLAMFAKHWKGKPELVRRALGEALYTPACGLALHSTADAELVLSVLREFGEYSAKRLSAPDFSVR